MSMSASPILSPPPPPHDDDGVTLRQPRRYSRKALASRFDNNIGPLDALALFAFEEALNACDTTPYGLPHEWNTGDARPAPDDGCYCLGMLGDDLATLVVEAQRIYRGACGQQHHLFLGLGRTDCGRIAITYELVDTSPPRGERAIRATPEEIARHHSWLTPTEMVALSCFLDESTTNVLLARHWSDVPHPMGINIGAVKPEDIVDRIAVNLWPVRLSIEDAHKARSRIIIALQKTEKATILWYGAIADDNIKATTASTTSSPVSTKSQTTSSRDALVQLPASKRSVDDSRASKVSISAARDHSRLLVAGPQDPRDCAAVLGLYPDVSPDGLVVVFELDRTLADLPRQWWNATSATKGIAGETAHGSAAVSKEIDLSKRQVRETAEAIRDAIAKYVDQYNDKDVVAVLWARPSSTGGIVTIGYALATLVRATTIDSDALALAAAGDCAPVATRLGDIIKDTPDREKHGNDDAICGGDDGDDDDDDVPPLEPIPHDLFDLVQLCPWLTGLQIAALSCIAESLKEHGICFKWLPSALSRFDHTQQVKTRRWNAEWAAHSIMNAYYATVNPGGMIEIGIAQRKDGGIDCMCAFVSRG
ncbi:hypothetical protein pmac_cds_829 [Pandoravirus macleodensis]|uniref:Uncharacterized protein n=1 Tax=Pandoravirus macleodensis TaxID=2107707 RepID=A0A2U7UGA5_9VIRU|nr:hypothetical protein pmac_cds_829 [Pandoravirus macleodensis]AVK77517.1 hypothetical protein pmac_cds_829 [Pandoravirus macleodensis]